MFVIALEGSVSVMNRFRVRRLALFLLSLLANELQKRVVSSLYFALLGDRPLVFFLCLEQALDL